MILELLELSSSEPVSEFDAGGAAGLLELDDGAGVELDGVTSELDGSGSGSGSGSELLDDSEALACASRSAGLPGTTAMLAYCSSNVVADTAVIPNGSNISIRHHAARLFHTFVISQNVLAFPL